MQYELRNKHNCSSSN